MLLKYFIIYELLYISCTCVYISLLFLYNNIIVTITRCISFRSTVKKKLIGSGVRMGSKVELLYQYYGIMSTKTNRFVQNSKTIKY